MVSFFGTETSPSSGDSSPTIIRNSVVLPAPLGPTRPTFSPGLGWKDASTKSTCRPYCLLTREKEIMRPPRARSSGASWSLIAFPLVHCDEQPCQGLHRQHDDHVPGDRRLSQAEARGDDKGVAERVARADQPIDDGSDAGDVDIGHRERHRNLQQ